MDPEYRSMRDVLQRNLRDELRGSDSGGLVASRPPWKVPGRSSAALTDSFRVSEPYLDAAGNHCRGAGPLAVRSPPLLPGYCLQACGYCFPLSICSFFPLVIPSHFITYKKGKLLTLRNMLMPTRT